MAPRSSQRSQRKIKRRIYKARSQIGKVFEQFDPVGVGAVPRADFELGLKSLGLELSSDIRELIDRTSTREDSCQVNYKDFLNGLGSLPSAQQTHESSRISAKPATRVYERSEADMAYHSSRVAAEAFKKRDSVKKDVQEFAAPTPPLPDKTPRPVSMRERIRMLKGLGDQPSTPVARRLYDSVKGDISQIASKFDGAPVSEVITSLGAVSRELIENASRDGVIDGSALAEVVFKRATGRERTGQTRRESKIIPKDAGVLEGAKETVRISRTPRRSVEPIVIADEGADPAEEISKRSRAKFIRRGSNLTIKEDPTLRASVAQKVRERGSFRKIWRAMDSNHEGFLNHDQLRSGFGLIGFDISDAEFNSLVRECDPKRTGKIEYATLLSYTQHDGPSLEPRVDPVSVMSTIERHSMLPERISGKISSFQQAFLRARKTKMIDGEAIDASAVVEILKANGLVPTAEEERQISSVIESVGDGSGHATLVELTEAFKPVLERDIGMGSAIMRSQTEYSGRSRRLIASDVSRVSEDNPAANPMLGLDTSDTDGRRKDYQSRDRIFALSSESGVPIASHAVVVSKTPPHKKRRRFTDRSQSAPKGVSVSRDAHASTINIGRPETLPSWDAPRTPTSHRPLELATARLLQESARKRLAAKNKPRLKAAFRKADSEFSGEVSLADFAQTIERMGGMTDSPIAKFAASRIESAAAIAGDHTRGTHVDYEAFINSLPDEAPRPVKAPSPTRTPEKPAYNRPKEWWKRLTMETLVPLSPSTHTPSGERLERVQAFMKARAPQHIDRDKRDFDIVNPTPVTMTPQPRRRRALDSTGAEALIRGDKILPEESKAMSEAIKRRRFTRSQSAPKSTVPIREDIVSRVARKTRNNPRKLRDGLVHYAQKDGTVTPSELIRGIAEAGVPLSPREAASVIKSCSTQDGRVSVDTLVDSLQVEQRKVEVPVTPRPERAENLTLKRTETSVPRGPERPLLQRRKRVDYHPVSHEDAGKRVFPEKTKSFAWKDLKEPPSGIKPGLYNPRFRRAQSAPKPRAVSRRAQTQSFSVGQVKPSSEYRPMRRPCYSRHSALYSSQVKSLII